MIKAGKSDKQHIIHILIHSFEDNQSVNYLIKTTNKDRMDRIRVLIAYAFEICFRYGAVFLSEDRTACALILYPEQKRYDLFALYQDVRLLLFGMGLANLSKAIRRENVIKQIHPKERMCYLWFIGVLPMWQGRGKGSLLLSEIVDLALQERRCIYLETSSFENLPWYKKMGFKVYHSFDLGYTLYFLRNR